MQAKRVIVFCTVLIAALLSLQAVNTIIAAVSEWPPFQYSENGEIKGADVEILRAVFKEMNQPLKIDVYPWSRCVRMAQDKQVDIIFTLTKNREREEYLIFPREPINISQNVLFIRKNSTVRFDSYNDLKGLTIGVSKGYTYGAEFDNSKVFSRSEVNDDDTNFRMLEAGRIDAFVCDKLVGVYLVRKLGFEGKIIYLPKIISELQMFVGFSKKQGAQALADRFDVAIAKVRKSGLYQQILDRYTK